jgi:trk system potassium uptake protein TrkH
VAERARGRGERLVAQRARVRLVGRLIALHGPPLTALTAPPALAAALEGEWRLAAALGLVSLPPLAAFAHLRFRGEPVGEPRRIEALAAVAAIFLIGALMAAPAFWTLGMSPVDALFEAVSGITTTGLTLATGTEDWPLSAHFLRAWLQWLGGFAFAVAAVALVLGPGVVAVRLGFGGGPGESILGSARSRARRLLGAYLGVSAVALAALAATAGDPLEGVFVAMTAVSTAGWSPAPDSLASIGWPGQAAAMAAMIAGAVSMTLWARAPREGAAPLVGDRELRLFLGLLAVAAGGVALIEGLRAGPGAAWAGLVAATSAQTTAGFSAGPTGEMAPAALLLLIAAMGIGGSVGSTAGGIKVFRFAFAAAAARLALTRAALSPRALATPRVLGRAADPEEGMEAFALVGMFVFGAGLAWLALLLAGAAPLPALFDAVSAFATAGLSAGALTPELPAFGKLALALAMLLGRLEFVAFLALVSPATWVRGA